MVIVKFDSWMPDTHFPLRIGNAFKSGYPQACWWAVWRQTVVLEPCAHHHQECCLAGVKTEHTAMNHRDAWPPNRWIDGTELPPATNHTQSQLWLVFTVNTNDLLVNAMHWEVTDGRKILYFSLQPLSWPSAYSWARGGPKRGSEKLHNHLLRRQKCDTWHAHRTCSQLGQKASNRNNPAPLDVHVESVVKRQKDVQELFRRATKHGTSREVLHWRNDMEAPQEKDEHCCKRTADRADD